jgi:polyphosphate kinase 2
MRHSGAGRNSVFSNAWTPAYAGVTKLFQETTMSDKEKSAKKDDAKSKGKLKAKDYAREMKKLHVELVKVQEWVKHKGLKVMIVFEGRDGAGKGGTIKAITEREKSQMHIQRYIPHFPAAGEVVIFDRSWYNRAGVEHVMGFCSEAEYEEFLRFCPFFEEALQNDGMILVKYWLSVSDEEQERRFKKRLADPRKRWKFSPIDLQGRARWVDYAEAKDRMLAYTDTELSPWYVVEADDKRAARLNLISHLLSQVPYVHLDKVKPMKLPSRQQRKYLRPPKRTEHLVPARYEVDPG